MSNIKILLFIYMIYFSIGSIQYLIDASRKSISHPWTPMSSVIFIIILSAITIDVKILVGIFALNLTEWWYHFWMRYNDKQLNYFLLYNVRAFYKIKYTVLPFKKHIQDWDKLYNLVIYGNILMIITLIIISNVYP